METITTTAPPSGIDPALVLDFDYYSDPRYTSAGGIPEAMAELRVEAPDVFWSTALGGYWVIQGYDVIIDAAKRTDLFSSSYMRIPPRHELPEPHPSIPLQIDPPDHAAFRAPLTKVFTATQMYKRVGQIRELAVELIDEIAPLGKADFFTAVTEKLPVLIFIDIMGLNKADFRTYRDLAKAAVGERDLDVRYSSIDEALRLLREVIIARTAKPEDDLISYLLELEINGEPVSEDLVLGYCKLLFFAGLDTVANAMAFCMRYLAMDQTLQQRLREEPDKIPHAMEELMRRHAVAPVIRKTMKDENWHGYNVRAGDMVLLNYPAANLDERMFDHADKVDIDRERINHIAFGAGDHRCVGRHLARIEIVVMLEEVMKRIPAFRIEPGKDVPMRGGSVLNIEHLPLVWDPA
ncbi:MAG: cytochrome P450 [Sphingomonadaceae bacterium]|nr:cytochrome P450 [Sphingomonadaceae bacterium]